MSLKQTDFEKAMRQFTVLWTAVLCFLGLGIIGCADRLLPTPTSEVTAMIVIRQADSGQTFTAHPGDRLEVLLDENPSTGYSWEITGVDQQVLSESSSSFYSASTVLGQSGTRRFQFEVKAPGETTVLFRLSRPWEAEAEAIEQFQVKIRAVEN